MGVAIALFLSAAFGAGDQYLGSLAGHPWAADVSLLSAPWLAVGFFAGATQRDARRAALVGLACTFAAILGYFLLTDSPLENAHYSLANACGFVISDPALLVGGLFTGPVFGWLGRQWRTQGAWLAALVTAAALCLEPLARRATIDPIRFRAVWLAEVAAGVLLAAVAFAGRRSSNA